MSSIIKTGGIIKIESGKQNSLYKSESNKDEQTLKINLNKTSALKATVDPSTKHALKYAEPLDCAKPEDYWRAYIFKGIKSLEILHLHRKSMYLFGRDKRVVDIRLDNPSCSSQHAVLQFRQKQVSQFDEDFHSVSTPYMIDLESTNGTCLNGVKLKPMCFYELRENDILEFGLSSRRFVLLRASKY